MSTPTSYSESKEVIPEYYVKSFSIEGSLDSTHEGFQASVSNWSKAIDLHTITKLELELLDESSSIYNWLPIREDDIASSGSCGELGGAIIIG